MTGLQLRQQIADYRAGRPVSNFVDPAALTAREVDLLKDGFRAINEFRDRVRAELTGDVLLSAAGGRVQRSGAGGRLGRESHGATRCLDLAARDADVGQDLVVERVELGHGLAVAPPLPEPAVEPR